MARVATEEYQGVVAGPSRKLDGSPAPAQRAGVDPTVVVHAMQSALQPDSAVLAALQVDYAAARQRASEAMQPEPDAIKHAWSYIATHCMSTVHGAVAAAAQQPGVPVAAAPCTEAGRASAAASSVAPSGQQTGVPPGPR
eukprot:12378293-Alexandrium_andersonii.AAC.1